MAGPWYESDDTWLQRKTMPQSEGETSKSESTDQFTEMAWIKFLGIEPLDASEGRAVIRLDPQPVHLNHNGTVNAPILYALAEVAGAGAVVAGMLELAARSYTVVKRASIEYLAPARGAVTATGEIPVEVFSAARALVEGGEAAEVEVPVDVCDSSGAVAAKCTLVVAVRPRRPTAQEQ
jgi:acyl-coenzyme A thioesterase PaaI-like protein